MANPDVNYFGNFQNSKIKSTENQSLQLQNFSQSVSKNLLNAEINTISNWEGCGIATRKRKASTFTYAKNHKNHKFSGT